MYRTEEQDLLSGSLGNLSMWHMGLSLAPIGVEMLASSLLLKVQACLGRDFLGCRIAALGR